MEEKLLNEKANKYASNNSLDEITLLKHHQLIVEAYKTAYRLGLKHKN